MLMLRECSTNTKGVQGRETITRSLGEGRTGLGETAFFFSLLAASERHGRAAVLLRQESTGNGGSSPGNFTSIHHLLECPGIGSSSPALLELGPPRPGVATSSALLALPGHAPLCRPGHPPACGGPSPFQPPAREFSAVPAWCSQSPKGSDFLGFVKQSPSRWIQSVAECPIPGEGVPPRRRSCRHRRGAEAKGLQAPRSVRMVRAGPAWTQPQGSRGFPGKALRTSLVKGPERSCAPESRWNAYLGWSVQATYGLRETDFSQGHGVMDKGNGLRMKGAW
ncbi:uncharacterized protein LOC120751629 isoform X2 [Hirundo rustica]|uniref:uncharacterized protein LOC120751629 isoform X2 n=1 Tax=Hirundo rustica TaxID=43150 RepID=UPI002672D1F4|nr:uncharacterized protein LOC120751629 isoform X2 [Hirundo rustica]